MFNCILKICFKKCLRIAHIVLSIYAHRQQLKREQKIKWEKVFVFSNFIDVGPSNSQYFCPLNAILSVMIFDGRNQTKENKNSKAIKVIVQSSNSLSLDIKKFSIFHMFSFRWRFSFSTNTLTKKMYGQISMKWTQFSVHWSDRNVHHITHTHTHKQERKLCLRNDGKLENTFNGAPNKSFSCTQKYY